MPPKLALPAAMYEEKGSQLWQPKIKIGGGRTGGGLRMPEHDWWRKSRICASGLNISGA